jgi:hypothetical protein
MAGQVSFYFASVLSLCFGLPLVWPLQIEEARKLSYHVKVAVHEEGLNPPAPFIDTTFEYNNIT